MKITNQVIFLGLLILAACLISLMSFSRIEGYSNSYDEYYKKLDKAVIDADNASGNSNPTYTGNLRAKGSSYNGWDGHHKRDNEIYSDDINYLLAGLHTNVEPITNNTEFLTAVTSVLKSKPDTTADTAAIYAIETQIAGLHTKNAQTLLSEMGNPNISYNPRAFLTYMNWYGANCPIDSNVCVNVV